MGKAGEWDELFIGQPQVRQGTQGRRSGHETLALAAFQDLRVWGGSGTVIWSRPIPFFSLLLEEGLKFLAEVIYD